MGDSTAICDTTRRCQDALLKLAASGHGDALEPEQQWADNQAAHLRIWAASLGVNASGRMSIAYRLRLNAPMSSMILQLLESLESCLKSLLPDTINEVEDLSRFRQHGSTGSRLPWRSSRKKSYDTVVLPIEDKRPRLRKDAASNLALLLDVAVDLRKLGTEKEEQRAIRFAPIDDEGRPLLPAFERYVQTQCRLHLIRSRAANAQPEDQAREFDQVATGQAPEGSSSSSIVSGLTGRHDDQSTSWLAEGLARILNELIEGDDDRFRGDYILDRLQATVVQRWRLLCYRSHHARSLAKRDELEQHIEMHKDLRQTTNGPTSTDFPSRPLSKKPKNTAIVPRPPTFLSSTATELTADRSVLKKSVEDPSPKSVVTRSSGVALKDADFPDEPRVIGEQAVCPLCWIPMPAKELRGRSWRSHVLRDLSPYFCMFKECTAAEARYPTSKLLRQHIEAVHVGSHWSCPRCPVTEQEEHSFCNPAEFGTHLRGEHPESISESDIDFIIQHAVLRTPPTLHACVFCHGCAKEETHTLSEHWLKLFEHMIRDHMQSLAMLSLPWDMDTSSKGSNAKDTSIESSVERIEDELEELREAGPLLFDSETAEPGPKVPGIIQPFAQIRALYNDIEDTTSIWVAQHTEDVVQQYQEMLSEHWARDVFDYPYPSTPFRPGCATTAESRCEGVISPDAMVRLEADTFKCVYKLYFDSDTCFISLWYRPMDARSRLLFHSSEGNLYCIPLSQLRIVRNRSELRLCRVRSNGVLELWALLNFITFERLVLVYSTIVAMKRQDVSEGKLDHCMVEDSDQLDERVHFHGLIRHYNMRHALRLLEDKPSGVLRLEATPWRGSMARVPLWTAFITKYAEAGDLEWAVLREGTCQVLLASLNPPSYVFVSDYVPLKQQHGWVLDFDDNSTDAMDFLRIWAGLCQNNKRPRTTRSATQMLP